jgi:hypothetical protein
MKNKRFGAKIRHYSETTGNSGGLLQPKFSIRGPAVFAGKNRIA